VEAEKHSVVFYHKVEKKEKGKRIEEIG